MARLPILIVVSLLSLCQTICMETNGSLKVIIQEQD